MDKIKQLEQWALSRYEEGGHWVYETFEAADYQEYLDDNGGDIKAAQRDLEDFWELMEDRRRDCQYE
jgi:hypothetical protein